MTSIMTAYRDGLGTMTKENWTKNGIGKCIAKVRYPSWMDPEEAYANACLLAAATDMPEALDWCCKNMCSNKCDEFCKSVCEIRAIIHKAKGWSDA
jgi:hypothetical protein